MNTIGSNGLDWSEVHEEAEGLEHHISDRVLDAIDGLIGHPSEDPHGHVIPDREGRMPSRRLAPLASLAVGARGTVREIRDDDRARMSHWKKSGLIPGAEVRMHEVRDVEDIYEIEVAGRRILSGSEGLEGVLVSRARGGDSSRPGDAEERPLYRLLHITHRRFQRVTFPVHIRIGIEISCESLSAALRERKAPVPVSQL